VPARPSANTATRQSVALSAVGGTPDATRRVRQPARRRRQPIGERHETLCTKQDELRLAFPLAIAPLVFAHIGIEALPVFAAPPRHPHSVDAAAERLIGLHCLGDGMAHSPNKRPRPLGGDRGLARCGAISAAGAFRCRRSARPPCHRRRGRLQRQQR